MVKGVVVCGAVFSAKAPVVLLFLAVNLFIIAVTTIIGSASYYLCVDYDSRGDYSMLCESIRIYVLMIGIACLSIAVLLTITALIMFCLRREMPTYVPASAPPAYGGYAVPVNQQPPVNPAFAVNHLQQQPPTQVYTNPNNQPINAAFPVGPAQQQQHYQQMP